MFCSFSLWNRRG